MTRHLATDEGTGRSIDLCVAESISRDNSQLTCRFLPTAEDIIIELAKRRRALSLSICDLCTIKNVWLWMNFLNWQPRRADATSHFTRKFATSLVFPATSIRLSSQSTSIHLIPSQHQQTHIHLTNRRLSFRNISPGYHTLRHT